MKRIALLSILAGAVAVGSVAAIAADPIKDRQALMKEVGRNAKLASDMSKGAAPFNATQAEGAMKAISEVPDKFVALLAKDTSSKESKETSAKPEVWTDMADFKAKMDGMKKASLDAAAAAKEGLDPFKAAFAKLGQNCAGCHEKFREKKS